VIVRRYREAPARERAGTAVGPPQRIGNGWSKYDGSPLLWRAPLAFEQPVARWRSVGVDSRKFDDLGPLLGFVADKFAEFGG